MEEALIERIERYLQGELTREEQLIFESELATNEELASLFNIYNAIETEMPGSYKYRHKDAELKKTLQRLNAIYFAKKENQNPDDPLEFAAGILSTEAGKPEPQRNDFKNIKKEGTGENTGRVRKIMSFVTIAAAASVVLFLAWFFFFNKPSVKLLADHYIREHLETISPSLGNNKDSLEIGKSAFNKKNYSEAEKIFNRLSSDKNLNLEAIEYLGILYLVTQKYDQAILQFDTLSKDTTLHANFGPFYKAIALIERNHEDDRKNAKIILEKIISNDLPGRKESGEWIKEL